MATTTMVHVRVDEQVKAQATQTLAAMGLTVSDAVRVFSMRVVAEQKMPFALETPNAETRAAMAEADEIARTRRARFGTASNCSMISKKTAASKHNAQRAPLPRAADYAKSFLKDWERSSRCGRHDTTRLKDAMLLLIASDAPLGPEWPDHPHREGRHRLGAVGIDHCHQCPVLQRQQPRHGRVTLPMCLLFELGPPVAPVVVKATQARSTVAGAFP